MKEYLAFVDYIGETLDGGYIYRFDFTVDIETVWGEFFHITPSALIPNLQPDQNTLSSSAKVTLPKKMAIAKNSFCFSMQDCIDGITPLIFSEIDESTLMIGDTPFFLNFGEPISSVEEKLKAVGSELIEKEDVEKGDETPIDDLIDSIDNNDDNAF